MNIIDCFWEQANIGKKTVEIEVEENDLIDSVFLSKLESDYEYLVVKVHPGNIQANIDLENAGFHLIETQIGIELKYKDFNFDNPLVKFIERGVSFMDVTDKDELEEVLVRVTPDMFISDRVALDPLLGKEYSCRRYCNWMKTAFQEQSASFFQILYNNEHVGFSMYRIKDGIWHGDLGGIYHGVDQGIGLLTACASFLYIRQRNIRMRKMVSAISSNNTSVLSLFNYCHYLFTDFKYVFVKHRDSF